jgi:hypothetical protein
MADQFGREDRALLVRLEERIAGLQRQIDALNEKIETERENGKDSFISRGEFAPVQRAVYAAIGLVTIGAVGIIVQFILKMN